MSTQLTKVLKQAFRGVLSRFSENMQQIYRRASMSKFDFNKVAKQNINMDILVIGTSTQFFLRGSYAETKFSKNKLVTGKLHSL